MTGAATAVAKIKPKSKLDTLTEQAVFAFLVILGVAKFMRDAKSKSKA